MSDANDTDYLLDLEIQNIPKKVTFSDVIKVYTEPIDQSIPLENIIKPIISNKPVKSILRPPKYKSFSDQQNITSCTVVIILLLFLSIIFVGVGILIQKILILEMERGNSSINGTSGSK
ncbi:hypothetical protein TVAG_127750 [Trichomonas vaginalis G3]|uniref:Uncharacterized protein n=1 Tax=Trichomonas vaginalis (strain ATCC PRA-98 / G3) TaxID=412133 RepID=A2G907_TRIV3|nr:hypothetical protein TVAGG3_0015430 [Trichomonas vaginalis G3]EAX86362.1 hypothetical protein TVAG_127750 [Trichomonas vaginalis G3]KAI5539388.1 hypothetical protein TVAGG3_0015430 [Trichomonas vaginalis G3]|eukprot:XP_001299292.1 hypothetical protein [Trichomonas vaginalis G3]